MNYVEHVSIYKGNKTKSIVEPGLRMITLEEESTTVVTTAADSRL